MARKRKRGHRSITPANKGVGRRKRKGRKRDRSIVTVKKAGRTFKLGAKIRSGQLKGKRPILSIS